MPNDSDLKNRVREIELDAARLNERVKAMEFRLSMVARTLLTILLALAGVVLFLLEKMLVRN